MARYRPGHSGVCPIRGVDPESNPHEGGASVKKASILTLTALVVALAVPALASNTGFKLNYPLVAGGRNFVSVPYFYFPSGDIADTTQNSNDLCNDFETGDCAEIVNVTKFNKTAPPVLLPFAYTCGSAFGHFDIVPGEAYFVNARTACTADIVGSHDNNYSVGGTSSITVNNGSNAVSIPYHVQADDSKELCNDIAAANGLAAGSYDIDLLTRINPATGLPIAFACPAAFGMFPITPGEALFIKPVGSTTVTIEWTTF
jgi:hypothetical protein